MQEDKTANIVSKGSFNIVTIFGFDGKTRHHLAYIFDWDRPDAPIHKCAISEAKLVEAAKDLPEKI